MGLRGKQGWISLIKDHFGDVFSFSVSFSFRMVQWCLVSVGRTTYYNSFFILSNSSVCLSIEALDHFILLIAYFESIKAHICSSLCSKLLSAELQNNRFDYNYHCTCPSQDSSFRYRFPVDTEHVLLSCNIFSILYCAYDCS